METVKTNSLKKFNNFLENPRTQEYLLNVLGEKKSSFINNLTALVSNSYNLQECDPATLMYAAMKSTALSLPLDQHLGFAYVIPFRDNRSNKTVAQFQLGYRGFIQLSMRSGQFKKINVREVKDGEIIGEDFISGEYQFKMIEENRSKVNTIGYVAYFKLNSGFEKMLYMSIDEIIAHGKKFSKTFQKGYGLWKDDFDSMASKTVLKLLLSKYAPMSVEIQNAVIYDQAVISEDGKPTYIDNNSSFSYYTDITVEEKKQILRDNNSIITEMP